MGSFSSLFSYSGSNILNHPLKTERKRVKADDSADGDPLKAEREREMYKSVGVFPSGVGHLKHFDNNPHPDRISDRELAYAQYFDHRKLNINYVQKRTELEGVKNFLGDKLSEIDKMLINLTDKIE